MLVLERVNRFSVLSLTLVLATRLLDASDYSNKIEGPDSCIECHKQEGRVWRSTAHSQGFLKLHREPEARLMAKKMGVRRIKADNQCASCHYTTQLKPGMIKKDIIAGVSCESCHGPARDWIDVHNEYVDGGSKRSENPEQKLKRLLNAKRHGFRSPHFLYSIVDQCFACHAISNEKLVNVGGHSIGSEFELVAWSQGKMRHNFCSSENGKVNMEATVERKRTMFVLGKMVQLEYALRSIASATQKATFAIDYARQAARARKDLEAIQLRVSIPEVARILEIVSPIELRLSNRSKMGEAAESVKALAKQFAGKEPNSDWTPLDELLPKPEDYR